MSDRVVAVEPDATVAVALSQMEKHGVRELPVMEKSNLRGWISYDTVLRRGVAPSHTKVSTVMEQPPRLAKDADLAEAAQVMIHSNVRAVAVVDGKGKLVGVLSRTDILRAAEDLAPLAGLSVDALMNSDLETCDESEPVDRALARLRSLQIRQLLVLDGNGRLAGYVSEEDLIRAWTAEHAPQQPQHARGHSARGAGQRVPARVEVKGFVKDAPTVARGSPLKDAVRRMRSLGSNFVVVAEDGYGVGVVSRSNVVERVAQLRPLPGVLCQIAGLNGFADPSELDTIHATVEHTLKKIAPEMRIEFVNLHYKVYKAKTEGDSKFALSLHLSADGRFWVQKADAWNPLDAARMALDNLEQRIHTRKEMRIEKRRAAPGRRADFYTATRA